MQPKVSMVVPCYNKETYIGDMLTSVYAQTWDNIELVAVNDGSTDGTRDVLESWRARLEGRGHSLHIIDQENQGLPAAVRNGLAQASGEFVCTVDSDDELYPTYVSTMAGWLHAHPEDDFAVCRHERVLRDEKGRDGVDISYSSVQDFEVSPPKAPFMMENFLLARSSRACWIYMMRADYMRRCRIVENYCVEPRYTQEPSIVLPLGAGGGKGKVFYEALYRYNLYSSVMAMGNTSFERAQSSCEEYSQINQTVIERLSLDINQKERLLCINEWNYLHSSMHNTIRFQGHSAIRRSLAERMLAFLKRHFSPAPDIGLDKLLGAHEHFLYRAVMNAILEHRDMEVLARWPQKGQGRVIGYGALGKRARGLVPLLQLTPLRLDELWDQAATEDSECFGYPVQKPDYGCLREEDLVIVFAANVPQVDRIREEFEGQGVRNYLTSFEIRDCLAAHFFPMFRPPCTFFPRGDDGLT